MAMGSIQWGGHIPIYHTVNIILYILYYIILYYIILYCSIFQSIVIPYHIFPTTWGSNELLRVSQAMIASERPPTGVRIAIQWSPQLFGGLPRGTAGLKHIVFSWFETCLKRFKMIMYLIYCIAWIFLGSLRLARWLETGVQSFNAWKSWPRPHILACYWASLRHIQATFSKNLGFFVVSSVIVQSILRRDTHVKMNQFWDFIGSRSISDG